MLISKLIQGCSVLLSLAIIISWLSALTHSQKSRRPLEEYGAINFKSCRPLEEYGAIKSHRPFEEYATTALSMLGFVTVLFIANSKFYATKRFEVKSCPSFSKRA